MKLTKTLVLYIFISVLLSAPLLSIAQDITEAPLDTLTRSVATLVDKFAKMDRLKITGYVQPQYQYIDSAGAPSVAGGDFIKDSNPYYSRFTMRRGRIKTTYTNENVMLMVNVDITERGLFMRETYAKISDPWLNMFSLTAGLLQTQFGFELVQSSSDRETPERARFNQVLFPVERDLGAFGSVVVPKSSKLFGLKLDVAVMNGVGGVNPEFDNHKDFTGRLQYTKTTVSEKIMGALGVSYYYGGYKIGKARDYNFTTLASGDKGYEFAEDTANYNRVARRAYMGIDFQGSVDWKIGITTLRAEYIMGENPGTSTINRAPLAMPAANTPLYHRNFNGAYFYLIQNIGQSKFQVVLKYDWFDPNVKVAGEAIGVKGTNTALGDIRFDTYGFGLNYHVNHNLKFTAYYDLVQNEKTMVSGYQKDIRDNVFTFRMQLRY